MPEKALFFVPLTGNDRIRVRITTNRGRVTHFTVQYETRLEGTWRPVVRCDTAHGQAHIDYLDRHGTKIAKTELGVFFPFDEALQWSLDDIAANWVRYRERFIRHKERR